MILFCTFLVTRSHRRNAGRNAGTSNPCSEPTNPRYQKQLLLVVGTWYIPLKSLKIRPNACAWVALQVVPKSSPLGLGNVHAARLSAPSYFSSYPWLHRKIRPILFQFGSYKKKWKSPVFENSKSSSGLPVTQKPSYSGPIPPLTSTNLKKKNSFPGKVAW